MSCINGREQGFTSNEDLIVTGEGEQSVSWVANSGSTSLIDFWTFCPGFTVGADDTIDAYKVADLTAVTKESHTLLISDDASFGNSARSGGVYQTSSPNRTVAATATCMTGKDYYELASADPFVPNDYFGETAATLADPAPTRTWPVASVELPHREFIGLASFQRSFGVANSMGASSSFGFHCGTSGTNLGTPIVAGRRVVGLTVTAFGQRLVNPEATNSEYDQPYRVRFGLRIGSKNYLGQVRLLPNAAQDISFTWRNNPDTGGPWTQAALSAFQNGGANGVLVFMSRPDQGAVFNRTAGALYRVSMTVDHVQETRVASWKRESSTQTFGWNKWEYTLFPTWETDTDYLFNMSRLEQEEVDRAVQLRPNNLGIRTLGANTGAPLPSPRITAPDFVEGIPRNVGNVSDAVPTLVTTTLSPNPFGNPFAVVDGLRKRGVITLSPGFPDSVRQRVTGALPVAPLEPDRFRFTARSQFDDLPTGPLDLDVVLAPAGGEGLVVASAGQLLPQDLSSATQWTTVERELVMEGSGLPDVKSLVAGETVTRPAGPTDIPASLVTLGSNGYVGVNSSPARIDRYNSGTETWSALTLAAGENNAAAMLTYSGGPSPVLLVGCATSPGKIVRVDLVTFTRTDVLNLLFSENNVTAMVVDGTHLYVGTQTSGVASTGRIIKIDLATFTRVAAFTLSAGEISTSMVVVGTRLFVGVSGSPGGVVAVNLSTFSRIEQVALGAGEGGVTSLATDGTNVYAVTNSSPARVVEFEPNPFQRLRGLTLDTGDNNAKSCEVRDEGLYVVLGTTPGRIAVVDIERLLSYGSLSLEAGEGVAAAYGVQVVTTQTPYKLKLMSVSGRSLYQRFAATTLGTGWQVLTHTTGEDEPGATRTPLQTAVFSYADFQADVVYADFQEDDLVSVPGARVAAVIGVAPSPPDNVTARVELPATGSNCRLFVVVEWDAHVDTECDEVTGWEVQRKDPNNDWQTIFTVVADVTEVWDVEAARNVPSTYRVRSVDANGNFSLSSDWSDEVSVTPQSDCCGYVIASNHLASGQYLSQYPEPEDRSLWYDDVQERSYEFLSDVSFVEFESGDSMEIVRPLVDKLETFSTRLFVAGRGAIFPDFRLGNVQGRRLFDPLLELVGNKRNEFGTLVRAPYVAVLDGDGNRWYANVDCPSGVRSEPSGTHTLLITVKQTLSEPIPAIITEPMTLQGS